MSCPDVLGRTAPTSDRGRRAGREQGFLAGSLGRLAGGAPPGSAPVQPGGARLPAALRGAPVLSAVVLVLALCGSGVLALDEVLSSSAPLLAKTACAAALVVLLVVQLWFSVRVCDPAARLHVSPVLLLQAGLLALPWSLAAPLWPGMPGFLVGTLLLGVRTRLAVPAAAGAVGAVVLLEVLRGPPPAHPLRPLLAAVATLVLGLVVFGLTTMVRLVRDLLDARAELGRAAAEQERHRLARDVHDILGLGLSAITLKCELTARLLPPEADLARHQLDEVLTMARRALTDVRAVAHGIGILSLDEELALAEATLTAVDVRVLVAGTPPASCAAAGAVLATALREGVTNVLRHSNADWCWIGLCRDGGTAHLEIVNNGVRSRTGDVTSGRGLRNLAERAGAIGGTAVRQDDGAVHRLRVSVPVGTR